MKNNFKLKFIIPRHGWQGILFKNNNQKQLIVGASYAFPPYDDFLNVYQLLVNKKYLPLHFKNKSRYFYFENTQNKLRKREVTLNIDREGYDSQITFKPLNNKIKISTKTLMNSKKRSIKAGGRPKSIIYNKKQVFEELQSSLKEYNKIFNKKFHNDLKLEKKFLLTKKEEDYIYNDMNTELKCSHIIKWIINPNKMFL